MTVAGVDSNLIAFIFAPIIASALTLLVTRASKGHDARAAAEAALIGIGPTIIAEQNKRIQSLQDSLGLTMKSEQECRRELSECRTELASLTYRVRVLERRGWPGDGSPETC